MVAAVLLSAIDGAVASRAKMTTRQMAVAIAGEQAAADIQGAVDGVARDLADHGLIHVVPLAKHEMVELTRAALRYKELLDGER